MQLDRTKYDKHISYYIKEYVEHIRKQFYEHINNKPVNLLPTANIPRMTQKFEQTLRIDTTSSKKYTKIITMNVYFRTPKVHSFILNRDDNAFGKTFYEGDILYGYDFAQPDRDKSYGNVYYKNYCATWYMPLPPQEHNT